MGKKMQRVLALLLVVFMTVNTPMSTVVAQEVTSDSDVVVSDEVVLEDGQDEDVIVENEAEDEVTSTEEDGDAVDVADDDAEAADSEEVAEEEVAEEEVTSSAVASTFSVTDEVSVVSNDSYGEGNEDDWEYYITTYGYTDAEGQFVDCEGAYITAYTGIYTEYIVIPETIGGNLVIGIDGSTFESASLDNVTGVVAPDTVSYLHASLDHGGTRAYYIITENSTALESGNVWSYFAIDGVVYGLHNEYTYEEVYDKETGEYYQLETLVDRYFGLVDYITNPDADGDGNVYVGYDTVGQYAVKYIYGEVFADWTEVKTVTVADTVEGIAGNVFGYENDESYVIVTENSEALELADIWDPFVIDGIQYYLQKDYEDVLVEDEDGNEYYDWQMVDCYLILQKYVTDPENIDGNVYIDGTVGDYVVKEVTSEILSDYPDIISATIGDDVECVWSDIFGWDNEDAYVILSSKSEALKSGEVYTQFQVNGNEDENIYMFSSYNDNQSGEWVTGLTLVKYSDTDVVNATVTDTVIGVENLKLENIAWGAFEDCALVETVTIEDGVYSIENPMGDNWDIDPYIIITENSLAFGAGNISGDFVIEGIEYSFNRVYEEEWVEDDSGYGWYEPVVVECYLNLVGFMNSPKVDDEGHIDLGIGTIGGYEVKSLSYGLFEDYPEVMTVTVADEIKYIESSLFGWDNEDAYVILSSESEALKSGEVYTKFMVEDSGSANLYEFEDLWNSTTQTSEKLFALAKYGDTDVVNAIVDTVTIGDTIYNIEAILEDAFEDCTEIETVTVGDEVKSLDNLYSSNDDAELYIFVTVTSEAFQSGNISGSFVIAGIEYQFQKEYGSVSFTDDDGYEWEDYVLVECYLGIVGFINGPEVDANGNVDLSGGTVGDYEVKSLSYGLFEDYPEVKTVTVADEISFIELSLFGWENEDAYVILTADSEALEAGNLYTQFMILNSGSTNLYKFQYTWNSSTQTAENLLTLTKYGDTDVVNATADEVTIGDTVYNIGVISYDAFEDCTEIETVTVGDGVKSIDSLYSGNDDADLYILITEDSVAFQSGDISGSFVIAGIEYQFQKEYEEVWYSDDDGNEWYSYEVVDCDLYIDGYYTAPDVDTNGNVDLSVGTVGNYEVKGLSYGVFQDYPEVTTATVADTIEYIGSALFDWDNEDAYVILTEDSEALKSGAVYTQFTVSGGDDTSLYMFTEEYDWENDELYTYLSLAKYRDTDAIVVTLDETVTLAGVEYGLKGIEWQAFEDCTELEKLYLNDNITSISYYIFGDNEDAAIQVWLTDSYYNTVVDSGNNYDMLVTDGMEESNLEVYVLEDELLVVGYRGADAETVTYLDVPSELYGMPVFGIEEYAFWQCEVLDYITVDDSIEYIGTYIIPNNSQAYVLIESTDCDAFETESIYSNFIIADSDETNLYKWAYNYMTDEWQFMLSVYYGTAGETTVTIPEEAYDMDVSMFDMSGFTNCVDATSLVIGDNISLIYSVEYWDYMFNDLEEFVVDSDNTSYKSEDGALYAVSDGTMELLAMPSAKQAVTIIVPDTVTSVSYRAFGTSNTVTESLNIPSAVTYIDLTDLTGEFEKLVAIDVDEDNDTYSSLGGVLYSKDETILYAIPNAITSVTMPDAVTKIWDYAWSNKTEMTSLHIGSELGDMGIDIDIDSLECYTWTYDGVEYSEYLLVTYNEEWDEWEYTWYSESDLFYDPLPYVEDLRYAPSLESITVSEDNEYYSSEDGVLYNKDMTAIYVVPMAMTGDYEVPSTVTEIYGMIMSPYLNITVAEGNTSFVMEDGCLVSLEDGTIYSVGESTFELIDMTISNSEVTYGETFTVSFVADETTPSEVELSIGGIAIETKSGIVDGDIVTFTVDTSLKALSGDLFGGNGAVVKVTGMVDGVSTTISRDTMTLNSKSVTLNMETELTKVYDGSSLMGEATFSVEGLLDGDSFTVTGSVYAMTQNAIADQEIVLGDMESVGSDAAYYCVEEVNGTATITAKELVVTAEDLSVIWDTTDTEEHGAFDLTYTYAGLVDGEELEVTMSTKATNASTKGTYSITIDSVQVMDEIQGIIDTNYEITTVDGTLTVEYTTSQVAEDLQTALSNIVTPVLEDDADEAAVEAYEAAVVEYKTTVTTAAAEAIATIAKAETEDTSGAQEAKNNEELVTIINELDSLFVEATDNLSVETATPSVADSAVISEDLLLPAQEVEVQGLALAVYGSSEDVLEEETVLSIQVTQMESTSDELSLSIKPVATVGETTEVISNEVISAPITFKVYVNDNTAGEYIYIKHIYDDEKPDEYEIIRAEVLSDDVGLYVQLTVSEFSTFTMEAYDPGDVNSDGYVDLKDVTRLIQWISEYDVEVKTVATDTNGDDSIDLKDATRLLQYASEWGVEIY